MLAVIIMKAFIATSPKYPTFAVLTDSWTDRRTYVWRMKSYLEKYLKRAILFEDGFLDYSEIFSDYFQQHESQILTLSPPLPLNVS